MKNPIRLELVETNLRNTHRIYMYDGVTGVYMGGALLSREPSLSPENFTRMLLKLEGIMGADK